MSHTNRYLDFKLHSNHRIQQNKTSNQSNDSDHVPAKWDSSTEIKKIDQNECRTRVITT